MWVGGARPSEWNPLPLGRYESFVALELRVSKLTYFNNTSKEEYEEDLRAFMNGRTLVSFEEFMNMTEQEIENEMDISFLYG